jgi:hypothetical protein
MGCQCFKNIFKSSDIDYNSSENPNFFNIYKAREVVNLCLTNDCEYYHQYLYKILSFDDEDFQSLFEGSVGDDEMKQDLCERYDITNTKGFFQLIAKFENFQTILYQWYKNPKYYTYLIDLWKEFPNMNILKYIYEDEEKLEKELRAIDYSYWDDKIKKDFKECVAGSAEVQSCQIKNYISQYPEAKTLIDYSIKYKNNLKNYYENGMDDMKSNIKNFVQNFLKDLTKDYKNMIPTNKKQQVKGSSSLKKSINDRIQKFIFEDFEEENQTNSYSFIDFERVKEVSERLKDGKLLTILQDTVNNTFNTSLNLLGGINVGLGILQFVSSVHELYKCFLEHDEQDDKFKEELYQIQKRFEEHRNIGILPNDYDKSILIIYKAIEDLKVDRDDLISLIYRIDNAISEKKSVKRRSIFKIIKNVAKVGICAAGVVMTGGAAAIGFGIAGAAHGIRIICHSKRLHDAKKSIKNYKQTLQKAIELEEIIEADIQNFIEKYQEIRNQFMPKDIRNEEDIIY